MSDQSTAADRIPASLPVQNALAAGQAADRRQNPRSTHRVFQWIAPCIDGRLPDQSMFYQVRCLDISTGGLAFLSTREMRDGEELIVALGTTDDAVYMRSRVIQCQPFEDSVANLYRIGCEFVERYQARTKE
ncbi:MAG: PilZ domain-containing protein [Planctomycetota bacterium]|nr:PilZ domain-containing protein [Planctomycetota bacterium]